MKKTYLILAVVSGIFLLTTTSCKRDKTQTALEYMPNMYRGPAYETYSVNPNTPDGITAQLPPQGSIPRGYMPYEYSNTTEGYDSARVYLKMPAKAVTLDMASLEKREAENKELYSIFCTHCHGDKGDGVGILVEREKILGVPSYSRERLPDITEGSIYHVITYGKGIMGSHASQLTEEERWKIVQHVLKLRNELDPAEEEITEETQANTEA
jgi:mono/diheme cytochrome c family protein